jgi:hypothetical protein
MIKNHIFVFTNETDKNATIERIKTLTYFNNLTILSGLLIDDIEDLEIPEGTICKFFIEVNKEFLRWDFSSSGLNKEYILNPDINYKPLYYIYVDSIEL